MEEQRFRVCGKLIEVFKTGYGAYWWRVCHPADPDVASPDEWRITGLDSFDELRIDVEVEVFGGTEERWEPITRTV